MSAVGSISEWDDVNRFKLDSIGDCNGRKVGVLNQRYALPCLQFEARAKDGFSFSNRESNPMMARVTVRHKTKNGEEKEISLEVDTRKPEKPKPEIPKPEKKPKMI